MPCFNGAIWMKKLREITLFSENNTKNVFFKKRSFPAEIYNKKVDDDLCVCLLSLLPTKFSGHKSYMKVEI